MVDVHHLIKSAVRDYTTFWPPYVYHRPYSHPSPSPFVFTSRVISWYSILHPTANEGDTIRMKNYTKEVILCRPTFKRVEWSWGLWRSCDMIKTIFSKVACVPMIHVYGKGHQTTCNCHSLTVPLNTTFPTPPPLSSSTVSTHIVLSSCPGMTRLSTTYKVERYEQDPALAVATLKLDWCSVQYTDLQTTVNPEIFV